MKLRINFDVCTVHELDWRMHKLKSKGKNYETLDNTKFIRELKNEMIWGRKVDNMCVVIKSTDHNWPTSTPIWMIPAHFPSHVDGQNSNGFKTHVKCLKP